MKYLVVVILALVNFALQAEDQTSVDRQVLAMNFAVAPETTHSLLEVEAVSAEALDAGVGREVADKVSGTLVNISRDATAAPAPSFIWIFGSLVAGLLAIASGRLFQNRQQ